MPNICPVSNLLFIAAYYGMIFAEEMFGGCAACVASTFNFFKTDILFAFAVVNAGAILVRTHSLLVDRWEMKFWEQRYQKVAQATPVSPDAYLFAFLLVANAFGVGMLVVNWPYIILGAAMAFLLMVALVLYGQIYFRKALNRFRRKRDIRIA